MTFTGLRCSLPRTMSRCVSSRDNGSGNRLTFICGM